MIIVKIAIFTVLITVIYEWILKQFLKTNFQIRKKYNNEYLCPLRVICALLRLSDILLIIASAIYLLFIR